MEGDFEGKRLVLGKYGVYYWKRHQNQILDLSLVGSLTYMAWLLIETTQ